MCSQDDKEAKRKKTSGKGDVVEKLGDKNAKLDLSVVYDVLVDDLTNEGLLNDSHASVISTFREKYLEFPSRVPTKDGQLKLAFVLKAEPDQFERPSRFPRPLFCLSVPTSTAGEEKFYKKEEFFRVQRRLYRVVIKEFPEECADAEKGSSSSSTNA